MIILPNAISIQMRGMLSIQNNSPNIQTNLVTVTVLWKMMLFLM